LQQADGLWNWTLGTLIQRSLLAGLDFPFGLFLAGYGLSISQSQTGAIFLLNALRENTLKTGK
jgi:hypothetical protein